MSHRLHAILAISVLVILLLSSCEQATTPTPEPVPPAEAVEEAAQQSALGDTAWAMTSYGVSEQIPALPDTYPSLNFMIDRYNGYTGCNFILGTFYVDGDSLTINFPSSTAGPCASEDLTNQEENYLSAITAVDSYKIETENLYLYVNGEQVMTLEPLEPVPYEGTVWNFEFFQSDAVEPDPVIPGTTVTAKFEGDTISGNAGCNEYSGTVSRDDRKITISEVVATQNTCAEPEYIMDQEQRYLQQLQTAGFIQQNPRSIELRDTDAIPIMLFHAE
ncbi:MAG: META domain-containing protein [Caldilineaceae bacterium]